MNLVAWIAGAAGVALMTAATVFATPAPAPSARAPVTLRETYGLTAPRAWAAEKTALVLVDFQEEFFVGRLPVERGELAAAHARELLAWARDSGLTIAHVRNVAATPDSAVFAPGGTTVDFVAGLAPRGGELAIVKSAGGGFTRTDLDAKLRARGIDTIVVAGLMTHLAVDQTARDAAMLGYGVVVASDACATRDLPDRSGGPAISAAAVQQVALASLADRFADPMTTKAIRELPIAR
jgi:nicotinamidase-related amidase